MPARFHPPRCNGTCVDFVDHARHFCCTECGTEPLESPVDPPSPASTVPTIPNCPECRTPVDLTAALAILCERLVELGDEFRRSIAALRADLGLPQDENAEP